MNARCKFLHPSRFLRVSHHALPKAKPTPRLANGTVRNRKPALGRVVVTAQARASYAATLPRSDAELLSQIQTSVQQALSDGKCLLEVQFPVDAISRGDCIATSELNANMQAMRRFCEVFEWLGQAERVRVFFPDAGEMNIAVNGAGKNPATGQWDMDPVWDDWPGPLDYLLSDNLVSRVALQMQDQSSSYEGSGKSSVGDSVEVEDLIYVVGYPYEDYEEMLSVMELHKAQQKRRTIVFNGSLDNVRTAFLPFGRMKKLKEEFVPSFDAAFYIHTFRGQSPGVLYRAYPGPWKVLLSMADGGFKCVKEYEERPVLQDVAKEYFSGYTKTVSLSTDIRDEPLEEDDGDLTKYYEILGVKEGVSPEELKKSYRMMAMENHPDKGGDTQTFYDVNKAYAILKDHTVGEK